MAEPRDITITVIQKPLQRNIQKGANDMVAKKTEENVKIEEKEDRRETSRRRIFETLRREEESKQFRAFIFGLFIFGFIVLFEFLFLYGWLSTIVKIITIPIAFFLVQYFIWSPKDTGWGACPEEGYTKAVMHGNQFAGFIGLPSGKAFTKDWDVVNYDHPEACNRNDFSIMGMHLIFKWPFAKIYWKETEWERWYPTTKTAVIRREILRQFSLLPYPHYIETEDAEDKKRMKLRVKKNVVMRLTNPKKALFQVTTSWIDVVKPIVQAGCTSYIKRYSLKEMLSNKNDLGNELLKNMPDPEGKYGSLVEMIEAVYGVKIESISVLDISGSDQDEQDAIKAMAIAELEKEATLIKSSAIALSSVIEGVDAVFTAVVHALADKKDDQKEQQTEYIRIENQIKEIARNDAAEFQKKYGYLFEKCFAFIYKKMVLKDGKVVEITTPDSKGLTGDFLSMIATARMMNNSDNKKEVGGPVTNNEE